MDDATPVDPRKTIDELASLMAEFGLLEAELRRGDVRIGFSRRIRGGTATREDDEIAFSHVPVPEPVVPPAASGTPVSSPMTGIYYGSASPGSSPFVREGDEVSAGQIVGLIEAMKVFNEIPCPIGGIVKQVVAQSGQVVQPGDPLLIIA